VLLWDAAIGSLITRLPGHAATVTALRFAPGGQLLATGDENGVCRLWRRDAQTGAWQSAGERRAHSRRINALAFVDGGRRFVSASGDNTCAQWNVADSNEMTSLVLKHPDAVVDMAVTSDGQFAVTACDDGQLRVWSLADAQVLRTLTAPNETTQFTSLDLSSDGELLAAASAEAGTVRLWNLTTDVELSARPAGQPDAGNPEAIAGSSDAIEPWLNLGSEASRVWGVRFAPGRDRLLTIGGNDAELRDVMTSHVLGRYSPHGIVASAALSPDGTRIATGSWDRSVKIWDAASGRVVAKLPELHTGYINSVCYSPTGDVLLTASDDGTARLWNATTSEPLPIILRGHQGPVQQACYSPDGARILTAGADHTARLWNAQTGAEVAKLAEHSREVLSVAFSANGRRIITGSADNRAIVWDAVTGERIQALAGHTAGVTAVALSPDASRALTGSQDNTAKLWDAATGKEIITLSGHAGAVTAAEFSPDGSMALTGGRDGRTLLWPTVEWAAPAARQARRD
jgi:WD40 repeat protein